MCVRPLMHTHALKISPALYLGPSSEPWEGVTGHLATKPQGTGKEQGGQGQAFNSSIYSFSHSFSPQEMPSWECAHRPKAQCLFLVLGFFQLNAGHKERPCWKPLALTPLPSPQRQRPLPASKVPLATWKRTWPEAATPALDCGCPISDSPSFLGQAW